MRQVFVGWAFAAVLLVGLSGPPARGAVLQYGEPSAGRWSYGGTGHMTMFDAGAEGRWLNRLEVFASAYGATAVEREWHLYVLGPQRQILRDVRLPFRLFKVGADAWTEVPIPSVQVPREFGVVLFFDGTQQQGVYLGYTTAPTSHSFNWQTGGIAPFAGKDWMIRATVDDAATGDPEAEDLVVLRDGKAFFDRALGAEGEPLKLNLGNHAPVSCADVASVRLGAVSGPQEEGDATLVLNTGARVRGHLAAMTDRQVTLRVGAATRSYPRQDILRIDLAAVPGAR